MVGAGVKLDSWEKWATELKAHGLLSESAAKGCESPNHLTQKHVHAGHATHYAMLMHVCAGRDGFRPGHRYAVCTTFAQELLRMELSGRKVRCTDCGRSFENAVEWVRIVGPIND